MTLNFFLPFIITLTGGAKKVPTVIFGDVASRRHQAWWHQQSFAHKPIDFSSLKRPLHTGNIVNFIANVTVCEAVIQRKSLILLPVTLSRVIQSLVWEENTVS